MRKILKTLFKAAIWIILIVGSVFTGFMLFMKYEIMDNVGLKAGELPACFATTVKENVIEAVKNSPAAKTTGLEVLEVQNLRDTPDEQIGQHTEGVRYCSATLLTNAGSKDAWVELSWIDKQQGTWYVEVKFKQ